MTGCTVPVAKLGEVNNAPGPPAAARAAGEAAAVERSGAQPLSPVSIPDKNADSFARLSAEWQATLAAARAGLNPEKAGPAAAAKAATPAPEAAAAPSPVPLLAASGWAPCASRPDAATGSAGDPGDRGACRQTMWPTFPVVRNCALAHAYDANFEVKSKWCGRTLISALACAHL